MEIIPGQPAAQAPAPGTTLQGFSNSFSNFLQPMTDGLQGLFTAPPATPEEFVQRKSAWQEILNEPNAKAAILRMGLNMLRGTQGNESTGGAIARNALDAMDYYGAANELDQKKLQETEQRALEKKQKEASIAQTEVQTAGAIQTNKQQAAQNQEWANSAGKRAKQLELDLISIEEQLRAAPDVARQAQLQRQLEDVKRNGELQDAQWKQSPEGQAFAKRTREAELGLKNAQAGYYNRGNVEHPSDMDTAIERYAGSIRADIKNNPDSPYKSLTEAQILGAAQDKYLQVAHPTASKTSADVLLEQAQQLVAQVQAAAKLDNKTVIKYLSEMPILDQERYTKALGIVRKANPQDFAPDGSLLAFNPVTGKSEPAKK